MAKFAMVISKNIDLKSVKLFQKKYTEKNLKKNFKCNSVTLFDRNVNSWDVFEKKFKIKEETFEKLSWLLLSADKDTLIEYEHVNFSTRKFFIFSNDAMQPILSFDCLSDDVYIASFELNQDSAEEFIEKLDGVSDIEYRIGQLNEAQELFDSLENIADECNLNIFYRSAKDDIDEALHDAETNFENLKSEIQSIVNSSWTSAVII
ncbi:hypothetical protein [Limnohabitans sp. Rim28]|uniref:hypothetical protein n=1 Tax=Limnohabitans sp. Rim28 TaxID=1100720 RepID=UPI00036FA418|nr:hypothetical protein [Limnohabitans sp. Rim28]PVE08356.1 hypothetical protein B472_05065 [Limnohabitans sp. Rim28]